MGISVANAEDILVRDEKVVEEKNEDKKPEEKK